MRGARAGSLVALALVGCAGGRAPREAPENLSGLELPMRLEAGVRAVVDGEVAGGPARIFLDVAEPLTQVTAGCFDGKPPSSDTHVRIPSTSGGFEEATQIELWGARIGGRRIGTLKAALAEGEDCEVTLGSDVLSRYALEIDPSRRKLRLLPTRKRADYEAELGSKGAHEDVHLVELVRDPTADWPMLAVRLTQKNAVLTAPFILSTASPGTYVGAQAAKDEGLKPGPTFLGDLELPEGVELPPHLGGELLIADALELSPGFGLHSLAIRYQKEWENTAAAGVLGADVWGRFKTTVDASAGVLLLERPKVVGTGSRQRCERTGGEASEDACYELVGRASDEGGLGLIGTVWRDLPHGAQIHLEVLGPGGKPLPGTCQVGLSFAPGDRGQSVSQQLPWEGLEVGIPECERELKEASEVRFSLLEETPLEACAGTCVYAQGLVSQRVGCKCAGGGTSASEEAIRRFMEQNREKLKRPGSTFPPPEPDEPKDPGAE